MMKQRVLSLCALALLTASAPAPAPANYNNFGVAAVQRLAGQSKTQNVFISPVSIGIALSMAAAGAAGSTRSAILHVLDLSGPNANAANRALTQAIAANGDAQVGIANALWTRTDIPPNPRYVSLLQKMYGAKAQALHFGDPSAARTINAWTRAHTLGLIDRIVGQTSRADFAYLTNALAFKGAWSTPFNARQTRPQTFTNADGSRSMVQMMNQTGTFSTLDTAGYSILRLPYGKGGYAAYVVLPKTNDVSPILKELGPTFFDNAARSLQSADIAVSLPRFRAAYQTSLIPLLRTMGMSIAFSRDADFSPIHKGSPPLAITKVNHAAYVRVDEAGTTAAAATSVGIGVLAIRVPEKRFVVDHSFVLALRDEHTGALLFLGVIRKLPG